MRSQCRRHLGAGFGSFRRRSLSPYHFIGAAHRLAVGLFRLVPTPTSTLLTPPSGRRGNTLRVSWQSLVRPSPACIRDMRCFIAHAGLVYRVTLRSRPVSASRTVARNAWYCRRRRSPNIRPSRVRRLIKLGPARRRTRLSHARRVSRAVKRWSAGLLARALGRRWLMVRGSCNRGPTLYRSDYRPLRLPASCAACR